MEEANAGSEVTIQEAFVIVQKWKVWWAEGPVQEKHRDGVGRTGQWMWCGDMEIDGATDDVRYEKILCPPSQVMSLVWISFGKEIKQWHTGLLIPIEVILKPQVTWLLVGWVAYLADFWLLRFPDSSNLCSSGVICFDTTLSKGSQGYNVFSTFWAEWLSQVFLIVTLVVGFSLQNYSLVSSKPVTVIISVPL